MVSDHQEIDKYIKENLQLEVVIKDKFITPTWKTSCLVFRLKYKEAILSENCIPRVGLSC